MHVHLCTPVLDMYMNKSTTAFDIYTIQVPTNVQLSDIYIHRCTIVFLMYKSQLYLIFTCICNYLVTEHELFNLQDGQEFV